MPVLRIEGLRQGKDTQALRFFSGRYCGRFTEKMSALCGLCEKLIAKLRPCPIFEPETA